MGAATYQSCADGEGFCAPQGNPRKPQMKCVPRLNCGEAPPNATNGQFDRVEGSILVDIVELNCTDGYQVENGSCILYCLPEGIWSTATGYCAPKDCNIAPSIQSGRYIAATSTLYTDTATITCDTGYVPSDGAAIVTCLSNGTWSQPDATCNPVDCTGTLPMDGNGTFIPQGDSKLGDIALLICTDGYKVTAGPCYVECQTDGNWSITTARCTPIDCNLAPSIQGGKYVTATSTLYTDTATITCDAGYVPSDGAAIVTCLSNGTWSQPSATCDPVDCTGTLPVDGNGTFIPQGDSKLGDIALLICTDGYKVTAGPCYVECQTDGNWSITTASCSPIDCRDPPCIQHGKFVSTSTVFPNTAYIECNSGYSASDSSATVTCMSNGSWSLSTVTCDDPLLSTRFTYGYMANGNNDEILFIFVYSPSVTEVNVSAPLVGYTGSWTVSGHARLDLPIFLRTPRSTGIFDDGVYIQSSRSIEVYIEDPADYSSGGTVLIPDNHLSSYYVLASWTEDVAKGRLSEVLVVAVEPDTVIFIELPDGSLITKKLDRFQKYQLRTTDLTGGFVIGNNKIAVFAGHELASIFSATVDIIVEQMPPIKSLQREYIVTQPYPRNLYSIRVIATEDGTNIELSDGTTATVNRGEYAEYAFDNTPTAIVTNHPVMVAVYSYGKHSEPEFGNAFDEAMIVVPGISSFKSIYHFFRPGGVTLAVLNVIIPTDAAAIASLVLNDIPVVPAATQTVTVPAGGGSFTILHILVPTGGYEVAADVPFGAYLIYTRASRESWFALTYNF